MNLRTFDRFLAIRALVAQNLGYAALAQWLEAQGHNPMETAPWTIYWTDPGEEPDQGKWRTEIFWPVAGPPGSG